MLGGEVMTRKIRSDSRYCPYRTPRGKYSISIDYDAKCEQKYYIVW